MSGRLTLIEQKLVTINSATFQTLCDTYLFLREQELTSINRTGSQTGKEKTISGTPDTFFRLSNGSLWYAEHTTKAEGLVTKIKADIDKCTDEAKTGIPVEEIAKIIICFNSKINPKEEREIFEYALSKEVRIELIGLDRLALDIFTKYLILSKDILGIPLDTGQLLPFSNFIEEYNHKGGKLSTPLNNLFLNRESELAEIETFLNQSDILIISGPAGVGKTKIALEAANKFLLSNKGYTSFAVAKKDVDIYEDLKIHLNHEEDFVLLVDDANRQLPNFKQILGVFREPRKGSLKLIITVRDYAFQDVYNECSEFNPQKMILNKFTDKEITELIRSESFEIRHSTYQNKIINLADGNARLAVMSARLAKEDHIDFLLGDVSDLYDSYFQTFIKDFDLFGNKALLKTLGLVSFYFSIDRGDKTLINQILKDFEIDYHEFNEALSELEKRELIEIKHNTARISEQITATYFFYRVFIKDEILSFRILLFNYFSNMKNRFKDTIIPSNNSFGYENVLQKINSSLDEYLMSIYNDEDAVLKFFSVFWFYKDMELIEYFNKKTAILPEPLNPEYITDYQANELSFNKDKTLDNLSKLYLNFTKDSFISSLELSFEYCRKNPDALPELVKNIKESLLFEEEDHRYGFDRQNALFELLISKFNTNEQHYIEAFFSLARTFLSHNFRITSGGRNHTISYYTYQLPLVGAIKDFRKKVFETLLSNFDKNPNKVLLVLNKLGSGVENAVPEILEFDLSFVLPFIEAKLNPNNFEHVCFVQELIFHLEKVISNANFSNLKSVFYNNEYADFLTLDWNSYRGKREYDFDNYDDYAKRKETDLRSYFILKDKNQFEDFLQTIRNTISRGQKYDWGLNQALNIVVEENFIQNPELGFELLKEVIQIRPTGLIRPIVSIVNKSPEWAMRLWALIDEINVEYKIYWQLSFFELLPESQANLFFTEKLLQSVNSISKNCSLQLDEFLKFTSFAPNLIHDLLKIAVIKNEKEQLKIMLPFHFFEKYSHLLSDDLDLLCKAYIQQEMSYGHFDLSCKGLETLVRISPKFLIQYLTMFYEENPEYRGQGDAMPFVWNLDNHEALIEEAIDFLVSKAPYIGFVHPINSLFTQLNLEQKQDAKKFTLKYISKNNQDIERMNAIFDVIRHTMKESFKEFFLHYLSLNDNVEIFKEIWWRGNGGTYRGDVIIGEIQAREWHNILNIVEQMDNQLKFISIKTYIKREIDRQLRNGQHERKRKFTHPNW